MLAHINHPILGDQRYAPDMPTYNATRQMLHASSLTIKEVGVDVSCELPEEMQRVVEVLAL